jgi:nitrogen-specific signal transduction histidine kinase
MAPEATALLSEKQITTHDFVNSLSSVRSLAELLADHPGLEANDRSHFISIIRDETERLINLMAQLNLSSDKATS